MPCRARSTADRRPAQGDEPDPDDRQGRQDRERRLPQADHQWRHRLRAGSAKARRGRDNTPTFSEIVPPSGELYANPAASQAMLDDAMFDSKLAGQRDRDRICPGRRRAFINGTGTNQPKGFLTQPTSTADDTARAFGTLQYVGPARRRASAPRPNQADRLVQPCGPAIARARLRDEFGDAARSPQVKAADGAFLWQPAWPRVAG